MMNRESKLNIINQMYNNNMMMDQINIMNNPMMNMLMMNPMNSNLNNNPMQMNNMEVSPMMNMGEMNQMMNMGEMNPMMNMGEMNPMNNKVMNQMMNMADMNQMNNMMINQIDNNNIENREINNSTNLDIYYNENLYINSISKDIFSKDDDFKKIEEKLRSIYLKQEKKLFRDPYPKEIIERESPKETLEFLLKRGVMERYPRISYYINVNTKGIIHGWKHYSEFRQFLETKRLKLTESIFSKVSFDIPLRGAGGLVGLEFVNLENSKSKVLKFSKNAPKWRKVCDGLNLFGKCIYKKCEAYNKEVIFQVGINIKFDLNT